jgi:small-conductance mechanosensitive channel
LFDALPKLPIAEWFAQVAAIAASPQNLLSLALQLGAITALLLLAWAMRAATRPWTERLVVAVDRRFPTWRLAALVHRDMPLIYAWLLLAIGAHMGAEWQGDWRLVQLAADLAALWLVLRVSTTLLRDALVARIIATLACIVFALDFLGLLRPTESALDGMAITVGALRLSVLLVAKAAVIVALLLWGAIGLSRLIAHHLRYVDGLSLSIQLLIGNLIKIALVCIAVLVGLNTVGIDLTAFAVFSGAIGVGVGFGLQKIVSNFVSGIILLVERSIKPGDVIEVGQTFGHVVSLGARYAAVRGRDGEEYLIPNENLIGNQVVNWSYSSPLVRVDAEFGVGFGSNLREVRALASEAAGQTSRVLTDPTPVCHITGFGDSAINLVLRFWIKDPADGVTNVKGDVFLSLWETLREHDIQMPFPQRDLHLRTMPAGMMDPFQPQTDPMQSQPLPNHKQRTRAHHRTRDRAKENFDGENSREGLHAAGGGRRRQRVEKEGEE